jgi:hypothetical protein
MRRLRAVATLYMKGRPKGGSFGVVRRLQK